MDLVRAFLRLFRQRLGRQRFGRLADNTLSPRFAFPLQGFR